MIKELKKKKSRGPYGYSNELTKLMNNIYIKKQQKFPICLNFCNISSLFKNKGSKKDLNNHRGVFHVTVFRNILDKLIFNDEYQTIEKHLTDSNVGGKGEILEIISLWSIP